MADQPTNPRIEELRSRLKADPKSRLFYPLAEELRKLKRFDDAESTLREGLVVHTSYLSAWISLGRVLRAQHKNPEAIEVLEKALVLDPGNVVAARLLAEAYEETGETVQAVQKYKLVAALLPADEEVTDKIARLEAELESADSAAETERVSLRDVETPVFDQTADMPGPVLEVESPDVGRLEDHPVEEKETEEDQGVPPESEAAAIEGEDRPSAAVEAQAPLPEDSTASEDTSEEFAVSAEEPSPPLADEESSPFDETLPPFAEMDEGEASEAGEVFGGTAETEAAEGPWEPSGSVEDEPFADREEIRTVPLDEPQEQAGGIEGLTGAVAVPEVAAATARVADEPGGAAGSIRRRKIERLERWVAKVGVKGRGGDHL